MQEVARYNSGFKYILTAVDCFNRFALCESLKTKKPEEIAVAFTESLKKREKIVTEANTLLNYDRSVRKLLLRNLTWIKDIKGKLDDVKLRRIKACLNDMLL